MFPKQFEKIPFYAKTRDFLYQTYRKFMMVHHPQKYASLLYKESFGKKNDWGHPRDINEWIYYQEFKTDTTIWSKLADKYKVREYIKEKGLAHILVPLLAKYNSPDEIDFTKLPNQFVLKCNNGSGDAIIVKDKTKIVPDKVKKQLAFSYNSKFGLESAEPHYLRIKPCIIVEENLSASGTSLVDYKVWCFNGQPYCIFTVSNRNHDSHKADYNLFDLNWNKIDCFIAERYRNNISVQKPSHLNEILSYARILSEGFPQVRIDFYEVKDKAYFGEMTFTSQGGRMDYFTPEYLKTMGNQISIDKSCSKNIKINR